MQLKIKAVVCRWSQNGGGSARGSSRLGRLFPNSTLFIHLLGVILNIQENTVLEIPKLLEIVKLSLQMET